MELSEEGLNRELPVFVTDPSNKAKVEALIAGRKGTSAFGESSHKIELAWKAPTVAVWRANLKVVSTNSLDSSCQALHLANPYLFKTTSLI
jgi:hypothetical protein